MDGHVKYWKTIAYCLNNNIELESNFDAATVLRNLRNVKQSQTIKLVYFKNVLKILNKYHQRLINALEDTIDVYFIIEQMESNKNDIEDVKNAIDMLKDDIYFKI